MYTLVTEPLGNFIEDPNQPRKDFDRAALEELKASIQANGMLQPVLARKGPPHQIIDGAMRFRAKRELGQKDIDAILVSRDLKPDEIRVIQVTCNLVRQPLTVLELIDAIAALAKLNAINGKELAKHTGFSESKVCQYLAIANDPKAYDAVKTGKVKSLTGAYAIAKADADAKDGLIALGGTATRDQLEAARRKTKTVETVKVSRVRVPIPAGPTVTVAGNDITLSHLVDALGQAHKMAEKQLKEGVDVRTAEKVWIDKNKKNISL